MSEWLKDAAENAVETTAAHLQHRAFIESLLGMQSEQAAWALKHKIDEMDEEACYMFGLVLGGMINEAKQAAPDQGNQQVQMYLQGLKEIAHYANLFYQHKKTSQSQAQSGTTQVGNLQGSEPQPAMASQAAAPVVDTSEIEAMLEKFAQTGQMDPELIQRISTLTDPAAIERINKKLEEVGATEGSSPALDSRDFYRPRETKYQLKWPLSPVVQQHVTGSFDELEPEDQFHLLFTEFTVRAVKARRALDAGDITTAEATFQECLERAKQLEVGELEAESYEGFMSIAQRRGDRVAERKWLTAAQSARQGK